MVDPKKLGEIIIAGVISGTLSDPEEVNALFAVANGAPILKERAPAEAIAAGIGVIIHTLDAYGETIVAGKVYLWGDKRIRVQREVFGAGNIMDTYYRLYYIDETLGEKFLCVEVSYPEGVFGKRVYKSKLKPE